MTPWAEQIVDEISVPKLKQILIQPPTSTDYPIEIDVLLAKKHRTSQGL